MSKHRRGGTARVATAPGQGSTDQQVAGPSIVEVAVYGVFAAAVAGAVLVAAGHPRWVAGAVVLGAIVLLVLLVLAAPRAAHHPAPSTGGRRGRRRRR